MSCYLAYLHTSVGDMIKDSSSEYDFNDGLTHALIGRRNLDLLFLKLVFHQGPTRCKQEKCQAIIQLSSTSKY